MLYSSRIVLFVDSVDDERMKSMFILTRFNAYYSKSEASLGGPLGAIDFGHDLNMFLLRFRIGSLCLILCFFSCNFERN